MFRPLHQRFGGIIANATAVRGSLGSASHPLSSRGPIISPASAGMHGRSNATTCFQIESPAFLSRRSFNVTAYHPKSIDDVHVTIQSGSLPENEKANQSTGDSPSSSESTCSQGIPTNLDQEEEEEEEMFVVADPVLGLGNVQEWGGPRRGGRLEEPTRFGDWERKGRCTDF